MERFRVVNGGSWVAAGVETHSMMQLGTARDDWCGSGSLFSGNFLAGGNSLCCNDL